MIPKMKKAAKKPLSKAATVKKAAQQSSTTSKDLAQHSAAVQKPTFSELLKNEEEKVQPTKKLNPYIGEIIIGSSHPHELPEMTSIWSWNVDGLSSIKKNGGLKKLI